MDSGHGAFKKINGSESGSVMLTSISAPAYSYKGRQYFAVTSSHHITSWRPKVLLQSEQTLNLTK